MAGRKTKNATEAYPFVKWAGGKTQLLEAILARMPEKIAGTYHEPFLGGGAVFFKLKALKRVKKAFLSDANVDLMKAYEALRDMPEVLLAELEALAARNNSKDYYEIRAQDPDGMTNAQKAARLIYLNKTGFNGLYRVNSKGGFNVPFGDNPAAKIADRENLLRVHKALANTKLEASPFKAVLKRAKRGDFVYFDPPYQPVSKTSSFTAYAKGGFGEVEQRHLAQVVEELSRKGVDVLLSNSDTPLACELYEGKGYEVERVDARRAINSKASGRGAIKELLVRVQPKAAGKARVRVSASQLSIAFKS
ncbi:MAG TPA: DNA adenine methylase [Myxococcales bacterium]|jgi:DNA adenine methylase